MGGCRGRHTPRVRRGGAPAGDQVTREGGGAKPVCVPLGVGGERGRVSAAAQRALTRARSRVCWATCTVVAEAAGAGGDAGRGAASARGAAA